MRSSLFRSLTSAVLVLTSVTTGSAPAWALRQTGLEESSELPNLQRALLAGAEEAGRQDPLRAAWEEVKESWRPVQQNPLKELILGRWEEVSPSLKKHLEQPDPEVLPEFLVWEVLISPRWVERMRPLKAAEWAWMVDLLLQRWKKQAPGDGLRKDEQEVLGQLDRLLLERLLSPQKGDLSSGVLLGQHRRILRSWNQTLSENPGGVNEPLVSQLLMSLAVAGDLDEKKRDVLFPKADLERSFEQIQRAWKGYGRPSVWEASHLKKGHLPLLGALSPEARQAFLKSTLGRLLHRGQKGYDSMGSLDQADILTEMISALPAQPEEVQSSFWAALADRPIQELLDPLLEIAGDSPEARTEILRFLVAALHGKRWYFSDQKLPWVNFLYLMSRIETPEQYGLMRQINHLLLERFSGTIGIAREKTELRDLTRPLEDPNSFGPDLNGFIRREVHHVGGAHTLDLARLRLHWWYTGDAEPLTEYLARIPTHEAKQTLQWLAERERAPEADELQPAIRLAMERLARKMDRPVGELSVELLATVEEATLTAIRAEPILGERPSGWDRLFDREIPAYRILWELYGPRTMESAAETLQELQRELRYKLWWPGEPLEHFLQGFHNDDLPAALQALADLESAVRGQLLGKRVSYPKWEDQGERARFEVEFQKNTYVHHGIPAVRGYNPQSPHFQLYLLLERLRPLRVWLKGRLAETARSLIPWQEQGRLLQGVLSWMQAAGPHSGHLRDLSELLDPRGLTPARLRLVSRQLTRYLEGRMAILDERMGSVLDAVDSILDSQQARPALLLRPHLEQILFEEQESSSAADVFAQELLKQIKDSPEPELAGNSGPSGWIPLSARAERSGELARIGEKARNLLLLHQWGHPVPPAAIYPIGADPRPVVRTMREGIRQVEEQVAGRGLQGELGARFGDTKDPLLVSVRSGALLNMPGQMDTIANVGITPETLPALEQRIGAWGAWDAYRRFIQEFAMAVYGLDRGIFDQIIEGYKGKAGVARKIQLSEDQMKEVAQLYLAAVNARAPGGIPEDPWQQLELAIRGVVGSWDRPRVQEIRGVFGLDQERGTAVILQAMVHGNFSLEDGTDRSGAGVAITLSQVSKGPLTGSFGQGDQGFDIAEGVVTPGSLTDLKSLLPKVAEDLQRKAADLKERFGEDREIEFTVQNGKLWLLQDRMASVRGPIPRFQREALRTSPKLGWGDGLAGGAARGVLALSDWLEKPDALAWLQQRVKTEKVDGILLVMDTASPEDTLLLRKPEVVGFIARRGGRGQHEGIIANLLGLTAVAAVGNLDMTPTGITFGKTILHVGDVVSLDGVSGEVHLGKVPLEVRPAAGAEEFSDYNDFLNNPKEGRQHHLAERAKAEKAASPGGMIWHDLQDIQEILRLLRKNAPAWAVDHAVDLHKLLREAAERLLKSYEAHYAAKGSNWTVRPVSGDSIRPFFKNKLKTAKVAWFHSLAQPVDLKSVERLLQEPEQKISLFLVASEKEIPQEVIVFYTDSRLVEGARLGVGVPEDEVVGKHLLSLGAKPSSNDVRATQYYKKAEMAAGKHRPPPSKPSSSVNMPVLQSTAPASQKSPFAQQVETELLYPSAAGPLKGSDGFFLFHIRWRSFPGRDQILKGSDEALVRLLVEQFGIQPKMIRQLLEEGRQIPKGKFFSSTQESDAVVGAVLHYLDEKKAGKKDYPEIIPEILPLIDRNAPLGADLDAAMDLVVSRLLGRADRNVAGIKKEVWDAFGNPKFPKPPYVPKHLKGILLAGSPADFHVARWRWMHLPNRSDVKDRAAKLIAQGYKMSEEEASSELSRAEGIPRKFAFVTVRDARAVAVLVWNYLQRHPQPAQRPAAEVAREVLPWIDPALNPKSEMGGILLEILRQGVEHLRKEEEKKVLGKQLPGVLWDAAAEAYRLDKPPENGRFYDADGNAYRILRVEEQAVILSPIAPDQSEPAPVPVENDRLKAERWRFDPPADLTETVSVHRDDPTNAGAEEAAAEEYGYDPAQALGFLRQAAREKKADLVEFLFEGRRVNLSLREFSEQEILRRLDEVADRSVSSAVVIRQSSGATSRTIEIAPYTAWFEEPSLEKHREVLELKSRKSLEILPELLRIMRDNDLLDEVRVAAARGLPEIPLTTFDEVEAALDGVRALIRYNAVPRARPRLTQGFDAGSVFSTRRFRSHRQLSRVYHRLSALRAEIISKQPPMPLEEIYKRLHEQISSESARVIALDLDKMLSAETAPVSEKTVRLLDRLISRNPVAQVVLLTDGKAGLLWEQITGKLHPDHQREVSVLDLSQRGAGASKGVVLRQWLEERKISARQALFIAGEQQPGANVWLSESWEPEPSNWEEFVRAAIAVEMAKNEVPYLLKDIRRAVTAETRINGAHDPIQYLVRIARLEDFVSAGAEENEIIRQLARVPLAQQRDDLLKILESYPGVTQEGQKEIRSVAAALGKLEPASEGAAQWIAWGWLALRAVMEWEIKYAQKALSVRVFNRETRDILDKDLKMVDSFPGLEFERDQHQASILLGHVQDALPDLDKKVFLRRMQGAPPLVLPAQPRIEGTPKRRGRPSAKKTGAAPKPAALDSGTVTEIANRLQKHLGDLQNSHRATWTRIHNVFADIESFSMEQMIGWLAGTEVLEAEWGELIEDDLKEALRWRAYAAPKVVKMILASRAKREREPLQGRDLKAIASQVSGSESPAARLDFVRRTDALIGEVSAPAAPPAPKPLPFSPTPPKPQPPAPSPLPAPKPKPGPQPVPGETLEEIAERLHDYVYQGTAAEQIVRSKKISWRNLHDSLDDLRISLHMVRLIQWLAGRSIPDKEWSQPIAADLRFDLRKHIRQAPLIIAELQKAGRGSADRVATLFSEEDGSVPDDTRAFIRRTAELMGLTAGAEEVRIVEEKKPALDPALWAGLSIQKKYVLLPGALGRLGERFLRDGLKELRQANPQFEVEVIAVDRWDPDAPESELRDWLRSEEGQQFIKKRKGKPADESSPEFLPWVREQIRQFIQERMEAVGLPFIAYFPLREFWTKLRSDGTVMVGARPVKVDGVIPAVYTRDHLLWAQPWIEQGVPVWLDKPIVMPGETTRLRRLDRAHPKKVMGVDFFMYSDALLWLMADGRAERFLREIGQIRRIDGRCCEPWDMRNEDRSWLLKPELSGSTGLGNDTATHPLAMLGRLLELLGLSLKDAQVTGVVRGRYPGAPGTGETDLWIEGSVGRIPFFVDGGKGVDAYYYGITLTGTQGSIEVFVGTGEYDPYVKITRAGGSAELHTFPGGSLGYRNVWLDFLLLMHGSDKAVGGALSTRLDAMTGAVDLVGKAENFADREGIVPVEHPLGQASQVPLKVLGQVSPEMPKRAVSTDVFQRKATVTAGAEEEIPSSIHGETAQAYLTRLLEHFKPIAAREGAHVVQFTFLHDQAETKYFFVVHDQTDVPVEMGRLFKRLQSDGSDIQPEDPAKRLNPSYSLFSRAIFPLEEGHKREVVLNIYSADGRREVDLLTPPEGVRFAEVLELVGKQLGKENSGPFSASLRYYTPILGAEGQWAADNQRITAKPPPEALWNLLQGMVSTLEEAGLAGRVDKFRLHRFVGGDLEEFTLFLEPVLDAEILELARQLGESGASLSHFPVLALPRGEASLVYAWAEKKLAEHRTNPRAAELLNRMIYYLAVPRDIANAGAEESAENALRKLLPRLPPQAIPEERIPKAVWVDRNVKLNQQMVGGFIIWDSPSGYVLSVVDLVSGRGIRVSNVPDNSSHLIQRMDFGGAIFIPLADDSKPKPTVSISPELKRRAELLRAVSTRLESFVAKRVHSGRGSPDSRVSWASLYNFLKRSEKLKQRVEETLPIEDLIAWLNRGKPVDLGQREVRLSVRRADSLHWDLAYAGDVIGTLLRATKGNSIPNKDFQRLLREFPEENFESGRKLKSFVRQTVSLLGLTITAAGAEEVTAALMIGRSLVSWIGHPNSEGPTEVFAHGFDADAFYLLTGERVGTGPEQQGGLLRLLALYKESGGAQRNLTRTMEILQAIQGVGSAGLSTLVGEDKEEEALLRDVMARLEVLRAAGAEEAAEPLLVALDENAARGFLALVGAISKKTKADLLDRSAAVRLLKNWRNTKGAWLVGKALQITQSDPETYLEESGGMTPHVAIFFKEGAWDEESAISLLGSDLMDATRDPEISFSDEPAGEDEGGAEIHRITVRPLFPHDEIEPRDVVVKVKNLKQVTGNPNLPDEVKLSATILPEFDKSSGRIRRNLFLSLPAKTFEELADQVLPLVAVAATLAAPGVVESSVSTATPGEILRLVDLQSGQRLISPDGKPYLVHRTTLSPSRATLLPVITEGAGGIDLEGGVEVSSDGDLKGWRRLPPAAGAEEKVEVLRNKVGLVTVITTPKNAAGNTVRKKESIASISTRIEVRGGKWSEYTHATTDWNKAIRLHAAVLVIAAAGQYLAAAAPAAFLANLEPLFAVSPQPQPTPSVQGEWSWFLGPLASERLPDVITAIQHERAVELEEPSDATSPLVLSVYLGNAHINFTTNRQHARGNTPELWEGRSEIVRLLKEAGVRFQPGEQWVGTLLGPVLVADHPEAEKTEGFAIALSPFDPETLENEVPEPWIWGPGAESLGIYLDRLGTLYAVLGGLTVLEVVGPEGERFSVTLKDKASQRRVNAELKKMTEFFEKILPKDIAADVVSEREVSRGDQGRHITLTLANAGAEETGMADEEILRMLGEWNRNFRNRTASSPVLVLGPEVIARFADPLTRLGKILSWPEAEEVREKLFEGRFYLSSGDLKWKRLFPGHVFTPSSKKWGELANGKRPVSYLFAPGEPVPAVFGEKNVETVSFDRESGLDRIFAYVRTFSWNEPVKSLSKRGPTLLRQPKDLARLLETPSASSNGRAFGSTTLIAGFAPQQKLFPILQKWLKSLQWKETPTSFAVELGRLSGTPSARANFLTNPAALRIVSGGAVLTLFPVIKGRGALVRAVADAVIISQLLPPKIYQGDLQGALSEVFNTAFGRVGSFKMTFAAGAEEAQEQRNRRTFWEFADRWLKEHQDVRRRSDFDERDPDYFLERHLPDAAWKLPEEQFMPILRLAVRFAEGSGWIMDSRRNNRLLEGILSSITRFSQVPAAIQESLDVLEHFVSVHSDRGWGLERWMESLLWPAMRASRSPAEFKENLAVLDQLAGRLNSLEVQDFIRAKSRVVIPENAGPDRFEVALNILSEVARQAPLARQVVSDGQLTALVDEALQYRQRARKYSVDVKHVETPAPGGDGTILSYRLRLIAKKVRSSAGAEESLVLSFTPEDVRRAQWLRRQIQENMGEDPFDRLSESALFRGDATRWIFAWKDLFSIFASPGRGLKANAIQFAWGKNGWNKELADQLVDPNLPGPPEFKFQIPVRITGLQNAFNLPTLEDGVTVRGLVMLLSHDGLSYRVSGSMNELFENMPGILLLAARLSANGVIPEITAGVEETDLGRLAEAWFDLSSRERILAKDGQLVSSLPGIDYASKERIEILLSAHREEALALLDRWADSGQLARLQERYPDPPGFLGSGARRYFVSLVAMIAARNSLHAPTLQKAIDVLRKLPPFKSLVTPDPANGALVRIYDMKANADAVARRRQKEGIPMPEFLAGAEEEGVGYVAVEGMVAAVPARARRSTYGVTVGPAQTEAALRMGTLPPERFIVVSAGAEEDRAIAGLGVPPGQIVRDKTAAVELAGGFLQMAEGFREVRVLDTVARTLAELRSWLLGLPAAWQGALAAGVEEQVLQLEKMSQVGV